MARVATDTAAGVARILSSGQRRLVVGGDCSMDATGEAPFVVHCDVDVLSFNDTPLADVPDSGGDPVGLRLEELATSLAAALG